MALCITGAARVEDVANSSLL